MEEESFNNELLGCIKPLSMYAKKLYRYDRDKVDDLIQDTLTKAIAKQNLYNKVEGKPFLSWLITIMHHTYISNIKKDTMLKEKNNEMYILAKAKVAEPSQYINQLVVEVITNIKKLPLKMQMIM